ncbi:IclR family transcriptional regulator [Rathayibacter toxicus]|uniref:ArsR family transcriptional regulator n=1 Tax=Rathayibacter toxicus TaxID=145458 RepID=A0A0C5B870_9MICO|nr:IclR family transcriptional regulator [Rathayibacter toxicus]AJM76943.1 ArsR family transcriptional regulator [Rathayibacter toxicus]ALS57279.1 ArsR family transcriptional regulator [Rathayibacter toxicus]KKM45751.1 ArsR family transcriptional regulator [Rathayibacter toxicus]PPG24845.1 IclR family transcriptional regulator [Rathayibacter toxicus]PPG48300.1 IclR family transcriptional regulator [Rathayibacter toxicus]
MTSPDASENTVDKGSGAPAVSRAVRILDLLAEAHGQPRTLTDIARELGIAKSSTSNLCAALEEGRLVRRVGSGYLLGRRTVELGSSYLAGVDPVREFYRLCEDSPVLSRQLVQIALLGGTRVLYLAVHEGRERFALSASVGDRYPASATAVGTALLSGLDDAELKARFAGGRDIVVFTDKSTSTLSQLLAKVRAARQRGYAIDDGELHPSVQGIAFAVPAPERPDLSLAIGVSLVGPRISSKERQAVVDALQEAALTLGRPRLGPTPEHSDHK